MNNVIKFQKPKPEKPVKSPRQMPPWLQRVLVVLAVLVAFAAIWAYFQFMQQPPTVTPSSTGTP